jgi:hypothetical protein
MMAVRPLDRLIRLIRSSITTVRLAHYNTLHSSIKPTGLVHAAEKDTSGTWKWTTRSKNEVVLTYIRRAVLTNRWAKCCPTNRPRPPYSARRSPLIWTSPRMASEGLRASNKTLR